MKFDDVFNLDELPESQSYDPIPAGEYAAACRSITASYCRWQDTTVGDAKPRKRGRRAVLGFLLVRCRSVGSLAWFESTGRDCGLLIFHKEKNDGYETFDFKLSWCG
jgi:hypothetical protein